MLPNYERSLLSLTASILRHYGLASSHPSLPLLDNALEKKPRTVVLLVLDGMGCDILEQHLRSASFLRTHNQDWLSSVFPPTTVAATTTLESGLSPTEHGWLGWSQYFEESSGIVNTFTDELTFSPGTFTARPMAKRLLPYTSICARIRESGQATAFSLSPFGEEKAATLKEICQKLPGLSKEGRSYVYCYCEEPDATMHRRGISDAAVGQFLDRADGLLRQLKRDLPDSLIIVTADHGHRDVEWLYLEDYPELFSLLERPPSLEPRALSLFIRKGKFQRFATLFHAAYSENFLLLTHVEAMPLFGPGNPHPLLSSFIGDFLGIATGKYCLGYARKEKPDYLGHHAGLTPTELRVPLILL